jgi:hypothetical protein
LDERDVAMCRSKTEERRLCHFIPGFCYSVSFFAESI